MSSSVREKMARVIREVKNATWEKERSANVVVIETVRARDENGHFISDDPSTPENEAWVEKPKKKTPATKKATKKSSK